MEQFDFEDFEDNVQVITGEAWGIKDDGTADWAVRKIAEARQEVDKMAVHFERQLEIARTKCQNKENFFLSRLSRYFESVPRRVTKTTEKYALPSGDLVLKVQQPKYEKDDTALVAWLKENQMNDFVENKPVPKWGELKKQCTAMEDGSVIDTTTGEVVQGVRAEIRPKTFEVKVSGGGNEQ